MAGTDTPWARLDQTFAFQGSDDDDVDEEGNYGGHAYAQQEVEEQSGRQSRKGSVMTITIGHEEQHQHSQQPQQQQQRITASNTHHRTATTSTTSTASTITPANAGHQRQISQLSTQQQQQLHQQHPPRPSLDEQYATKPLPPVPQKGKLQKSTSNRSSIRPGNKAVHRSQPSASSIASSVSSFNIPVGDGGASTSSLTRVGSVSAPTTLLRPAQSSAGWFSSVVQNRPQPRDTAGAASHPLIEPPSLTPLDLPPLTSPPAGELLSRSNNQTARPITALAQTPLMAPLALPPLTRSRGGGSSSISSGGSAYPSHLPVAPPRSAPHGDAVSLFSVRSMNSVATSTGANHRIRDDSSSMYSERRIPASTAKHSPSLASLPSFSSSTSRLKPVAAVPGNAVRKFMRMAGKAASSAKDAMKGPLHSHNNDSTPSVGGHSSGGAPSIILTTPLMSPMLSPAPTPRPTQAPSNVNEAAPPAVRSSMFVPRRSRSKIQQLIGLDVGAVTGGNVSGVSPVNLRRSQSTNTSTRRHMPTSSASSASNVPTSSVLSPKSTTATTPSIWNTSMFNSDDENDEDEVEDTYVADDRVSGDEGANTVKSMSPSHTADDNAADTPDPAMASLLRSLSQTSTQPPPVPSRLHLGQQNNPADHQRTLLPPNRLLKIKRFSDPTMAPIIEHPDDTSNPSGSNSSVASSHYSDRETGANAAPVTPDTGNDEDASSFIPSRPAPIPVRSPSLPLAASPTQPPSVLSLTLFPSVPSISSASIAKHIPTIRLFPSSSDNQASAASPTSPATAATSPTAYSPSAAPATRKNTLPTSNDISNPWPISPPPRPPPPPPLHPLTTPEPEVGDSVTEVAEKRLSGAGSNATLFRTVQWSQMADPVRTAASSSTSTVNRLSLHARTKSNGSASESIATSIATSVANSSTSGSSALSSTVASTIGSSSRTGFGSFSSASTASNRHSYQMATPPMPPPPPPNYPLPPLLTSSRIPVPMSMSMSMPVSMVPPPPTRSAFDEDDEEVTARMMAARVMKKAAARESVRWRPTALGKSLFRREGSPGPSGPADTKSTGTPGLRSSLSTRSSLSATTLLAAQRVAQATRKTVEAVSEGGSGSSISAARQHELEMEKWREDLRSRIRMIPEGGEAMGDEGSVQVQATGQLSPIATQQPKMTPHTTVHEASASPVHETGQGGMI